MPSLRRTGAENACSLTFGRCPAPRVAVAGLLAFALAGTRARADAPQPSPAADAGTPDLVVTVRAESPSAPREDAAADSSVINDDRTPRAGETAAQLLSELPGVNVNRTGGLGSLATISLRGSTWDQVEVYVDGIPLNSGVQGSVDLSTLPLGDIERIEVYRGSSPIGFGTSALGGIVSITTRTPETTGVSAEVGAGSFETESASLSASLVKPGVRVYAGAHYLYSLGDFFFTSDNGTPFDTSQDHQVQRTNNAVSQADGVARVVFPLGHERTFSLITTAFWRDEGLAGFGSIRQTTDTSLEDLRLALSGIFESPIDDTRGGKLRAQVYVLYGDQKYRDPLGEISIEPADTNDQTWTAGGTFRVAGPIRKWLLLTGVLELRGEQFQPYDADARPASGALANRLFVGAGAEADLWWERARLHIIPSLRVEAIDDERAGFDGDTSEEIQTPTHITQAAPEARLAFLENLTDRVTLRANAGRYVRFPTMYELYGNSGFVLGNPFLLPEEGWNGDVGTRVRVGEAGFSATFDGALFASYVDNLIQFQEDAYGRARALNVGTARILGAEATMDARLTRYCRFQLNGTFIDARDISDDSIGAHAPLLPNLPPYHIYARPEGRLPIGQDLVLGAYVDLDFTDGNYLDPANLVALPPRAFLGAGVFAQARRLGLVFIASAQNLTDIRAFDFAGFPLPSRSFFLSARYTFTPDVTTENTL